MIPQPWQLALSGSQLSPQRTVEVARRVAPPGWPLGVDLWPRGDEADFAEQVTDARRGGARIHTLSIPRAWTDPRKLDARESSEVALRAIARAASLGVPMVQFFVTPVASTPRSAEVAFLGWVTPLAEAAAEAGVTLVWENNFDHAGADLHRIDPARKPESMASIFSALDSLPLRWCFDPTNFLLAGEEPYPHAYEILKRWIVNVHLKDCTRMPGSDPTSATAMSDGEGPLFWMLPVGQGSVRWEAILAALDADGFDGWLTFDPASSEGLESWLRTSQRFLARGRSGQESHAH